MALNTTQLQQLKAEIQADLTLSSKPMNPDGYLEIANILNTSLAVPDFYVWRSSVRISEIMGNGFDWTRVDNMTVGEARIWEFMTQLGFINPSQSNIRAGINEAFKGTAQDDTMRLAMYQNHLQAKATRVQKLFATGTGLTSTNIGTGPATTTVDSVTPEDVELARTTV